MDLISQRGVRISEIEAAVREMGSLKAPGPENQPDGFSGVFFQKYWDQVKDSVCSVVKDFFEGSAKH
ncbi:hypothetical protein RHSIM_Rhsim04G0051600 [Rhododendron simsii]|uniref:Uncharacterized protein n=1 Tax=Rhododendron simsii TaxID=118357 RepID=A0A834H4C9_RHOSS|nr:hypothetical protein RHSIM_Rhsim04G0051600 [Rhododendron simsii]